MSKKKRDEDYKIAHVAIAVPNVKQALDAWRRILSLQASEAEEVASQKVRLQFVEIGGVRLEFLEPTSEDSPISKFLQKRGSGIHHLAIEVSNLAAKLSELKNAGIALIDEVPKKGADGCLVAFIHPKSTAGILVELVEREGEISSHSPT